MSYRPSSGGGYKPPPGPSNYNVSNVRSRSKGRGVPWMAGCGLLLFGIFLGAFGLFVFALYWFGTPPSNQLLPQRDFNGVADVGATVSEPYLNTSVAKYLKDNPVNLNGIVSVKEIVLKILPNQQVDASLRVGNGFVDFDIGVTEEIGLRNGKIVLKPVGQPKVGKGNLPVGADKIVELANATLLEPQLNKSLTEIQVDNRKFRLVDISTQSGLISVKFNAI